MAYDNQQQPPREKHALNNNKLNLVTKNEIGKNATLKWDFYKNNPRIVVYTNVPDDKDNGRISANMDLLVAGTVLKSLRQAVAFVPSEAEPEFKRVIKNNRPNFPRGGGKPDGMVTESETMVGCDRDGQVWLAVTAHNRPRLKFIINHNEYHAFFHASGEQYSKGECSKLFAEAYADIIGKILPILAVDLFVDIQPPARNGGGNGGGNGGYRNNNGGGNSYGGGRENNSGSSAPAKKNDDFEDDLPF